MFDDGDEFDELRLRIERLLRRKNVVQSGDIISLGELLEYLNSYLGEYNKIFIAKNETFIKDFNRKNGYGVFGIHYKDKNIPKLYNIINKIDENGEKYTILEFKTLEGEEKRLEITDNPYGDLYMESNDFDLETASKILRNNYMNLSIFNKLLTSFQNNFPNTTYEWNPDKKNKYNQTVSDDMVTCYIDLDNIESIRVSLKDMHDIMLSQMHSKNYGKLDDFIDFYNLGIMNKVEVNINDLNPFLQGIARKALNQNVVKTLK